MQKPLNFYNKSLMVKTAYESDNMHKMIKMTQPLRTASVSPGYVAYCTFSPAEEVWL